MMKIQYFCNKNMETTREDYEKQAGQDASEATL